MKEVAIIDLMAYTLLEKLSTEAITAIVTDKLSLPISILPLMIWAIGPFISEVEEGWLFKWLGGSIVSLSENTWELNSASPWEIMKQKVVLVALKMLGDVSIITTSYMVLWDAQSLTVRQLEVHVRDFQKLVFGSSQVVIRSRFYCINII